MPKEISTVLWRQGAAREIEITYADGEVQHVDGSHADAAELATAAGLTQVDSPLGTIRWGPDERRPARRGSAPAARRAPKRIGPWLSG